MPLNRRIPKTGFRHENRFAFAVVNLDVLDEYFDAGAEVTPEILLSKDLIEPHPGGVKILARGELTKPLHIRAHGYSNAARTKIEAAGGKAEVLPRQTAKEKKSGEEA